VNFVVSSFAKHASLKPDRFLQITQISRIEEIYAGSAIGNFT